LSHLIILAGICVFVAGAVRGFSGFGAGLVMIGPLSLIYGLPSAVVTVAICDAFAAATLFGGIWSAADRKRSLVAAITAVILLPLGTYLLHITDEEILRKISGALILVFISFIALGLRWRGGGISFAAFVGFFGGLVGGATSLIGPPMVLYILARDEGATRTRATLALYVSVVVISQLVILFLFELSDGLVGLNGWIVSASFIPIYMAGFLVGRRLFILASESFYRRLTIFLVAISGCLAIAG
jgi:uncharacterized membrane protein YfcA